MKEKEMKKLLSDRRDQKSLSQLETSFLLDRDESDSSFPHVMRDVEPDQSAFHQKDFLMRNSSKLKNK